MSTEEKTWFSATELSLLGGRFVAGLPKTMQGVKWRAKKEGWPSHEVKGGGGPGGVLTEYQPPAPVLALIQSFLEVNPGFFKSGKTRSKADPVSIDNEAPGELPPVAHRAASKFDESAAMMYMAAAAPSPDADTVIDIALLKICLAACGNVYGEEFNKQEIPDQMEYAVDFYNLLVSLSAQKGGVKQMKRLELIGLISFLHNSIALGWIKKFPPHDYKDGCFF